jgi:hypothetical protein
MQAVVEGDHPGLEQVAVAPAPQVGAGPHRAGVIGGVIGGVDGPLGVEGDGDVAVLQAVGHREPPVGDRPLHRVAQHDDHPNVAQVPFDPGDRLGSFQVRRRLLEHPLRRR